MIENSYGLMTSVQRPQTTIFGKEAYPTFAEKAAAFIFALLQNAPFKAANRRVALAALLAFCEMNGHTVDGKQLDEKGLETLIRRAGSYRERNVAPEEAFREFREALTRAIH